MMREDKNNKPPFTLVEHHELLDPGFKVVVPMRLADCTNLRASIKSPVNDLGVKNHKHKRLPGLRDEMMCLREESKKARTKGPDFDVLPQC